MSKFYNNCITKRKERKLILVHSLFVEVHPQNKLGFMFNFLMKCLSFFDLFCLLIFNVVLFFFLGKTDMCIME